MNSFHAAACLFAGAAILASGGAKSQAGVESEGPHVIAGAKASLPAPTERSQALSLCLDGMPRPVFLGHGRDER